MPDFSVVIVAGGSGSRMKADRKKAFIELAGEPLILHTAKAFQGVEGVGEILVALPGREMQAVTGADAPVFDLAKLPEKADALGFGLRLSGVERVVAGGARRQDSVLNGLRATDENLPYVMIHDGARPFVTPEELGALMARTRETGAAILAHPVRDTLKRVKPDKTISETVPRGGLWGAQTPQAFKRQALLDAFSVHNEKDVTDDAAMYALNGGKCSVVLGGATNQKITTPEDLEVAEALLALRAARAGDIRPASAIFRQLPGGDTIFDVEPEQGT